MNKTKKPFTENEHIEIANNTSPHLRTMWLQKLLVECFSICSKNRDLLQKRLDDTREGV